MARANIFSGLCAASLVHAVAQSDLGAIECPCFSTASSNWAVAEHAVLNFSSEIGVPATYGLQGCQPYDDGLNTLYAQCDVATPPEHCGLSWCFVDEEVCRATRMCEGGRIEPECRDRPRKISNTFGRQVRYPLYYSYETCGSADSYTGAAESDSTNWTFVLVPLDNRPWSFKDQAIHKPIGIIPDLVSAALPRLRSDFLFFDRPTEQSLIYSDGRTWDACIHDIAIGAVDLCLGDFWVTQQRLLHTTFLPSLYQDIFWLVVKLDKYDDLVSIILKPFEPFDYSVWGFMCLFVVGSGMLLACAENSRNFDDFPEGRSLVSIMKGIYLSVMSVFSGGPIFAPKTLPGRLITLGIAFFTLISMASYTANLATFLISASRKESIPDLHTAIAQGKRVALASVAHTLLIAEYPELENEEKYKIVPYGLEAREVHSGDAGVAVIPQSVLDAMYAGNTVEDDCADGRPAEGESEARYRSYCPLTTAGDLDLKRDCALGKAGYALASLNVAVPVSPRHGVQVSWAVESLIHEGYYANLMSRYSNDLAYNHPICEFEKVGQADPLPFESLIGSFLVSMFFVGVGSCMAFIRRCGNKAAERHPDTIGHVVSISSRKLPEIVGKSFTLGGGPAQQAVGQQSENPTAEASSPKEAESAETYGVYPFLTQGSDDPTAEVAKLRAEINRLQNDLHAARSVDVTQADIQHLRDSFDALSDLTAFLRKSGHRHQVATEAFPEQPRRSPSRWAVEAK